MRFPTRGAGASTFAEDPARAAPEARIIWHIDLDPGTLHVRASPGDRGDPDCLEPSAIAPWLTLVTDPDGIEHAVLSDGWQHIRLDVDIGSLAGRDPKLLHYPLVGLAAAEAALLPLRRFLHLCRHRRFAASLFPADPRIRRWIVELRVHDALAAGASQRDIAHLLFGPDRDWRTPSDSVRSRVRRLVRRARAMAAGGYRRLLSRPRS